MSAATLHANSQNPAQLSSSTTDKISLIEQGRHYYQSGRFAEALGLWQQAAQTYQAQGNLTNQALSLSYLASAYKELGQWQAAETAIAQSLELLQQANTDAQITTNAAIILAQAWNTQGSLQLTMGNPEAALTSWQQAEAIYADNDDAQGQLGSQLNQAQALQSLGLYRQARTRLEEMNQQLQSQPSSQLKAKALQNLGVTLQRVGAFSDSLNTLQQSLAMTQQLGADTSAVLLGLGHTWQGLAENDKALDTYGQAAAVATTAIAKTQAQLSQLSLLLETNQITAAQTLVPQIRAQLPDLPASRSAIYARVNLAQSLLKLAEQAPSGGSEMVQVLSTAIQQAQELNDVRAESYALGQLGQIYEQAGQWADAQLLTEKALAIIRGLHASEIAYQWQWQLGRILCQGDIACTKTDKRRSAIAAYTEAISQLELLRTDLVANAQIQFSFREQVEPVYREFVTLLLTPSSGQTEISQNHLKKARDIIEALQLAELDNYFQSACLDVESQPIDQIDRAAAVLYPIVLPDRLAVILALQDQPLHYYETVLPQAEVESSLSQMRQSLSLAFPNQLRLQVSQQLYDWLIRPAEAYFTDHEIQTLVLVPDGLLRSLPIAALHDGHHYLIEQYSIAINSGLQLLETPTLDPEGFKLLLGGLTEARQGFSALPAAALEIEKISAQVASQLFLNQEFTQKNLQTQLQQSNSSVVHLITHGQFSSNQNDTFLLAWDQKIKTPDLSKALQTRQLSATNPIELLVLSACQTATGDNRAGLGLAGLALRSGARSTLASLWSVDDRSTAELMVKFYNALKQPGTPKAAALQQAQLAVLQQEDYDHPFFWAAFVMVGNWL
ncbi:CHAT domain-containing protein [Leptolyngbya sp. Heron Island J]|uniref:CHAT domain-containing protein n=1 Tax=Leptolyngbya sp. Heron Island J TaxID=1385935 RepID=UPI00190F2A01|nr:CHAT domain-containing protein [Leptolyngbya sp. Heron Island J]